jgi:hypothetical protein
MRVLALRLPASVTVPVAVAAKAVPAPAAPATPPPAALKLEGAWSGVEHEGGRTKYVTVTFHGSGGTYALEGAVSVSTPLLSVERPQKNTVRFAVQIRGGTRHYVGRWDGEKIVGKIADDAGGAQEVGTFELAADR